MSDITSTLAAPRRQLFIRRGRLTVVAGPDAGRSWLVDHDVLRIGSLPESEVVLTDSTVSRRHAEIIRTSDGVLLRDSGSTNGTFVGTVRVREVFLTPETRFTVGKSELAFTPEDELIEISPSEKHQLDQLVGHSMVMREVFGIIERVAPTDLTTLITGETGTGKELASRAMHNLSSRARKPFRVFDCGAAPDTLIESELFGHERGSFTGAHTSREGVFELADGGTIFLDEIGELPLDLQPKLLRVLEQREVRRVGSGRIRPIDVRVVAASNRDLRREVREGRFREDLYYRLAVVELLLPPLRSRPEDLSLLCSHLLDRARHNPGVRGVSPEVFAIFEAYHWPGNVRELSNVIERALPFTDGDTIVLDALPATLRGESKTDMAMARGRGRSSNLLPSDDSLREMPFKDAKEQIIEAFERDYLVELIKRYGGNVSRAARAADMDRKSITRLLKKHGIR
jgi:transcriptional regulator with GAF, ATPase, and Fis domain